MPRTESASIITTTGDISSGDDISIIVASSNMTLTLPDIAGRDGLSTKIVRKDITSAIVTIQGYDISQTIKGSVTLTLPPLTMLYVFSLNGVWNGAFLSSRAGIVPTYFLPNKTDVLALTNTSLSLFIFEGRQIIYPFAIKILLSSDLECSGTLSLLDKTNVQTIATISATDIPTSPTIYQTDVFSNILLTQAVMEFTFENSSSSGTISIHFVEFL